jgi:hypothetical protein
VYYETQKHTSFGAAAEELRELVAKLRLHICYFCKNLIEYNEYGGTDYRHDQLYCLRDSPEILAKIMKAYPKLKGYEQLLAQGIPDMDAIHSCSAFVYSKSPRP